MVRTPILLLLLGALPAAAGGATVYTFEIATEGPFGAQSDAGRVWVDGVSARLEWTRTDDPVHGQGSVEIWKEGGREHLVLDPKKKTYHDPKRRAAAAPGGDDGVAPTLPALQAPRLMNPKVRIRNVVVSIDPSGNETIAGKACRRFVLDVSYKVTLTFKADKAVAEVKARAELWLTETLGARQLPFGHGRPELVTGYEEVDVEIAPKLAALPGVLLKGVLTATRTFEGSEPSTDSRRFEVASLEEAAVPEAMFALPEGFVYKEPDFVQAKRLEP